MNKVPWKPLLAVLSAVLYGASPIDLIPDLIPLLGLVDDALVVPILLLVAYAGFRRQNRPRPVPVTTRRPPRIYS